MYIHIIYNLSIYIYIYIIPGSSIDTLFSARGMKRSFLEISVRTKGSDARS